MTTSQQGTPQRTPQEVKGKCEPVNVPVGFTEEPCKWLEKKATEYELKYLLAYADDGVIWGVIENGKLLTSDEAAPSISPKMRIPTLQECRLFSGEGGELYLWHVNEGWQARYIKDEGSSEVRALDEDYVLWGDHVDSAIQSQDDRFTVVADGAQGLRHAVPLRLNRTTLPGGKRPLRLTVRHYLEEHQGTGQLFIAYSRLVRLWILGEEGG
jgi:CRISPR-associated protein (TIGR03984 family)